jgi:hypothetical protein
MYWLYSQQHIKNQSDIERLSAFYKDAFGEIQTLDDYKNNSNSMLVKWTKNPFSKFSTENFPIDVVARINGPQSIYSVSGKLNKLKVEDCKSLDYLENILKWADLIDEQLSFEMNRRGDIRFNYKRPSKSLNNIDELILASRLSKHATYIIPTRTAVYLMNEKSVYIVGLSLKNDNFNSSIYVEIDDGFDNPFIERSNKVFLGRENRDENLEELNDAFKRWSNDNFKGSFVDYLGYDI